LRDNAKCGREECFADLFPLLGDQKAQDEIRRETPHLRHCGLLKKDFSCCLQCSLKENPYPKRDVEAVFEATKNIELLRDALDLHSSWEIGLLPKEDLFDLSPDQITALESVQYERQIHVAELQANIIAARLATIFAR
jgi:hypothetical protein